MSMRSTFCYIFEIKPLLNNFSFIALIAWFTCIKNTQICRVEIEYL